MKSFIIMYLSPNIIMNKSRLRWVGCKLEYKNYVQNFRLKEHGFQVVDIIHLYQDRGQWQVLVDTEVKL